MVLETPLLRVSRPVAACSRCRAAKVKCDGKLPACTACEKSNRASECSSTNDQFARGKERSYVATLESRVEKLEKKIQEARARRKSSVVIMHDTPESPTPRRASTDTVKATKPASSQRAARQREASDIDDLVSDFGLLAVNATARDFYGFTTEMSYARLIRSASTKEPLPGDMIKPLPPKFAATPLIQHYLNNIFTLWPIFEEATLYASVEAVYQQGDKSTPWDRWCVRMVLAIACISQSESRGDNHYTDAVGHVIAALDNAEDVLHPGYIASIQALVLWTIYATMDPHHFDSWTLVGAASRAMVDLGIHQDPSKNVAMSRTKLELRRRVYWCVYSLDRSTSLVQTRAFSFSDEAANVAYPFYSTPTSPKYSSPQSHLFQQSFDTAIDLFKIREIQSEWYMDLFQSGREPWQDPYPYVWKQYNRMSEWFQDMPQSTLPAVRSFFELELLYSYVYMLSPNPRVPHIQEYAQRLIFEHCIAYATNLLAVLDKPSHTVKPPVTYYDAMRAYMTGRQFVDVLSRNLDAVLDPRPAVPPTPVGTQVESGDPLAPPALANAPPFPSSSVGEGLPLDPTTRAINALNDYTTLLSRFGLRFGFIHWRDRFQRESASLSAQLHQRSQASAQASPMSQQLQGPTTYSPQWGSMSSLSPQQPQLMYSSLPATPPSLFPQQSSPYASSMSYNGNAYDASGQSPQQHGMTYDASPGQQQTWATPSPQPLPELPQPSGGQTRRAMVYGPGMPVHSGQGRSPGASSSPAHENTNGWTHPDQPHADPNSYFQIPPSMPQHSSGTWTQSPPGNWG